MNRIGRSISIAWRSERLITQRRIEVIRNQTGLMAAAGLVAGIGLIMLNVAAYFALAARMSPQAAALVVALVNFALAVILAVYANRISAEAEVRGAIEVRDMAIEDLEAEIESATREVQDLIVEARQVMKNPLGSALPGIVGPIVSELLKLAKK